MNRFCISDEFRIFCHRSYKIGTIGLHHQTSFFNSISHLSQRKYKIGTTIRQNMDAHTIIRIALKLPIAINVGNK